MQITPSQSIPIYPAPSDQCTPQVLLIPAPVRKLPVEQKYPGRYVQNVKSAGIVQIVLGILCSLFQCAAVAINDLYSTSKQRLSTTQYDSNYYERPGPYDFACTGIWIGVLFTITGVIGILSAKTNTKGRILAHIVMNVFCWLLSWTLLGVCFSSLEWIEICKNQGYTFSNDKCTEGNLRFCTFTFFGEDITVRDVSNSSITDFTTNYYPAVTSNPFYCKHAMFTAWLIANALLLVCSVCGVILFLVAVVFNSSALCTFCTYCPCCDTPPAQAQAYQVVYLGGQKMAVSQAPPQVPGTTPPAVVEEGEVQNATPVMTGGLQGVTPLVIREAHAMVYSQPMTYPGIPNAPAGLPVYAQTAQQQGYPPPQIHMSTAGHGTGSSSTGASQPCTSNQQGTEELSPSSYTAWAKED